MYFSGMQRSLLKGDNAFASIRPFQQQLNNPYQVMPILSQGDQSTTSQLQKTLEQIKIFLEESFEIETQKQYNTINQYFQTFRYDEESQKSFFKILFSDLLLASKCNIDRVFMIYQFHQQAFQRSFDDALLEVFTLNFAFDLLNFRYAKDILVKVIEPYVNQKDYLMLHKLKLKPDNDDNEDYIEFFYDVVMELIEKFPDCHIEIIQYQRTLFSKFYKKFEEQIQSLKSQVIKKEEQSDQFNCSICLNEITPKQQSQGLPCCHMFHEQCLMAWLKVKNQCPLCRREGY